MEEFLEGANLDELPTLLQADEDDEDENGHYEQHSDNEDKTSKALRDTANKQHTALARAAASASPSSSMQIVTSGQPTSGAAALSIQSMHSFAPSTATTSDLMPSGSAVSAGRDRAASSSVAVAAATASDLSPSSTCSLASDDWIGTQVGC